MQVALNMHKRAELSVLTGCAAWVQMSTRLVIPLKIKHSTSAFVDKIPFLTAISVMCVFEVDWVPLNRILFSNPTQTNVCGQMLCKSFLDK